MTVPAEQPPILTPVRADTDAATIVIVDGFDQAEAVARCAPAGTAVYAMNGPRGYLDDGAPTPELLVTDGKHVVVVLRDDPAAGLDVYTAATGLAEACNAEGAESVRFARPPGSGRVDISAVLAAREEGRRTAYLERLLKAAKPKPADAKPKPTKRRAGGLPAVTPERGTVVINGDRWKVITDLTAALQSRWDADRLFCYGDVLVQRDGATVQAITRDLFNGIIAETCATVAEVDRGGDTSYVHTWPDGQTVGAIITKPRLFAPLDRISQIPFVRPDGTICQTPGYDETTRTYLAISAELGEIAIPDEPTPGDIKASTDLLVNHLLEGFPFPTPADRANAVATILTPFIRALVPISPLGVVDGKQRGSGKNLFADVLSIIVFGRTSEPLPFSIDDEENRKVITSAFRTGATLFLFDEAHKLGGNNLNRALTGLTYKDRILGVSNMAEYPNNVTWLSLGNKVTVYGDTARRVYRIEMAYGGDLPENRPESDFKHPKLRQWATENRSRLVAACLTLIRAWYVAGQPEPELPFRFGSFEDWQRVLAGILHVAEIDGFLANVKEWRAESDVEHRNWTAHLHWLHETFGTGEFTSAMVVEALRRAREPEYPHNLPDPGDKTYSRALGAAYRSQRDIGRDGIRLVLAGERKTAAKVSVWRVEVRDETSEPGVSETPDLVGGSGGTGGTPTPYARVGKTPSRNPAHGPREARGMHALRAEAGCGDPPAPPDPPGAGPFDTPPVCPHCRWPVDSNGHASNDCGAAA